MNRLLFTKRPETSGTQSSAPENNAGTAALFPRDAVDGRDAPEPGTTHLSVQTNISCRGAVLCNVLLLLEAVVDLVEGEVQDLAAQSTNVLGGLIIIGDEDVDELSGSSIDTDLVSVVLRERKCLVLGSHDLDSSVIAKGGRVEGLVMVRHFDAGADVGLEGIDDAATTTSRRYS